MMTTMRKTIRDAVARFFSPVSTRLPGSKVLFSVGKNPGEFTPQEWYQAFVEKNEAAMKQGEDVNTAACCPYPGCEGHMVSGPSGGMSQNIKCDTCDRAWNLTSIIERMERI